MVDALPTSWGSAIGNAAYVQAMSGNYLNDVPDTTEDLKTARQFFSRFKTADDILIPKIAPVEDLLPAKTTILDATIIVSRQEGSWKVLKTASLEKLAFQRQVTDQTMREVEVKIFTHGQDDPDSMKQIAKWVWSKFEKGEQDMPTGVIAFSTAACDIRLEDMVKVTEPQHRGETHRIPTDLADYEGPLAVLPMKIFLGDGYSWMFVFEQKVTAYLDGTLEIKNHELPEAFVNLFRKIPAVASFWAPYLVIEVEDYIMGSTGDKTFRMNAAVDVQALARLAGWKCSKSDSSTLPLLTTGMGFFRFFKWSEVMLAENFVNLPPALSIEIFGYMKAVYSVYSTLVTALLYDTFPDSDVVTQVTRTTAEEFADYWSSLVISVLNFVTVDIEATRAANSRQQLCNALRLIEKGGEMSEDPPFRVKRFAQLIGPWPTLMKGGARFLPIVREHFIVQHEILKGFPLSQFEYIFERDISPKMKYYIRFGLAPTAIEKLNPGHPITSKNSSVHLLQHPSLKAITINVDVDTVSYKTLVSEAVRAERPMRDAVLEWGRLNVEAILQLFRRLAGDPELQELFHPYYEYLRLQYMNLGKSGPISVNSLDRRIMHNREQEMSAYQAKMQTIDRSIQQLQEHKDTLSQAIKMMKADEQRGFRSNRLEHREVASSIPSLRPFWKHKKPKQNQGTQKAPNIQPLEVRTQEHDDQVTVPPAPGRPTWKEDEEMSISAPSHECARKRARSRSLGRDTTTKFDGPSRERSRSSGRRQRSRHREPKVKRVEEPEPEKEKEPEPEVIIDESPLRSPSIQIDYSSPEPDTPMD